MRSTSCIRGIITYKTLLHDKTLRNSACPPMKGSSEHYVFSLKLNRTRAVEFENFFSKAQARQGI